MAIMQGQVKIQVFPIFTFEIFRCKENAFKAPNSNVGKKSLDLSHNRGLSHDSITFETTFATVETWLALEHYRTLVDSLEH